MTYMNSSRFSPPALPLPFPLFPFLLLHTTHPCFSQNPPGRDCFSHNPCHPSSSSSLSSLPPLPPSLPPSPQPPASPLSVRCWACGRWTRSTPSRWRTGRSCGTLRPISLSPYIPTPSPSLVNRSFPPDPILLHLPPPSVRCWACAHWTRSTPSRWRTGRSCELPRLIPPHPTSTAHSRSPYFHGSFPLTLLPRLIPPHPTATAHSPSPYCHGSFPLTLLPPPSPAPPPLQVLGVRPLDSFDASKLAHRKKLRNSAPFLPSPCSPHSPPPPPASPAPQVLGVRPLDSFDAIKVAHRKKLRDAEGKGDEAEIERIDRAYDAIMMRQLTMRKKGVTYGSLEVSKDIKFADQTEFLPWLPRYEKADNKGILINAAVSAVMAVWMLGAQSTDWKILQFLLSFYIFQLFMKLDPFYPQNTCGGKITPHPQPPARGIPARRQFPERAPGNPWLHVRREPFDFGLLPIPAIASYKEASTETLKLLRQRLIDASLNSEGASTTSPTRDGSQEPRVTCEAIESCLKLSKDQARLVLDTLASVLPTGSEDIDSLSDASPSDAAKIGTDVDLLLLFLFLQRYRRVPNRSSRDAAVLADVWPQGPSPFDSVSPTATSALQIKTSLATRQRFQTGHAEEEQQQLSFLQKNLPSVLQLLAEHGPDAAGSGDGTEPGTQVISIDKFELLGLFLRVNRPGVSSLLLSQVAPFFAEADAAMPPAPVPLSVAQDWLGPRLCCTSDHGPDLRPQSPSRPAKVPADRGGDSAASPTKSGDTPMGEGGAVAGSGAGAGAEVQGSPRGAAANGAMTGGVLSRRVWAAAGMTTVDGVAKMSVLKGETEVDSSCVRVAHCHDSVIYVLAPLKYASVIGCSDSIVVLGAVGKVVRVEACERLTLIAPCARIRIANCRECVFYLGCNSRPVILGDNHSLQIAPYNTFYPRLDYHLAKVGVDPAVNKWDMPLALGSLDAAAAAGAAGAGTAAGGAGGSAGAGGGGAGGVEGEGAKEGAAAAALDTAILMPPEKFVPFVVSLVAFSCVQSPVLPPIHRLSALSVLSMPHTAILMPREKFVPFVVSCLFLVSVPVFGK
ncbi:unnamed protein product [Closterium sp. NIES-54]